MLNSSSTDTGLTIPAGSHDDANVHDNNALLEHRRARRCAAANEREQAMSDHVMPEARAADRAAVEDDQLERAAERLSKLMTHPQVWLGDLGFWVDEGLAGLIRACWRRGIETAWSCIGTDPGPTGDGMLDLGTFGVPAWICLSKPEGARRWERLTGRSVDWRDGNPDGGFCAKAYFRSDAIPALVEALEGV
jgi:hypothetical protein